MAKGLEQELRVEEEVERERVREERERGRKEGLKSEMMADGLRRLEGLRRVLLSSSLISSKMAEELRRLQEQLGAVEAQHEEERRQAQAQTTTQNQIRTFVSQETQTREETCAEPPEAREALSRSSSVESTHWVQPPVHASTHSRTPPTPTHPHTHIQPLSDLSSYQTGGLSAKHPESWMARGICHRSNFLPRGRLGASARTSSRGGIQPHFASSKLPSPTLLRSQAASSALRLCTPSGAGATGHGHSRVHRHLTSVAVAAYTRGYGADPRQCILFPSPSPHPHSTSYTAAIFPW